MEMQPLFGACSRMADSAEPRSSICPGALVSSPNEWRLLYQLMWCGFSLRPVTMTAPEMTSASAMMIDRSTATLSAPVSGVVTAPSTALAGTGPVVTPCTPLVGEGGGAMTTCSLARLQLSLATTWPLFSTNACQSYVPLALTLDTSGELYVPSPVTGCVGDVYSGVWHVVSLALKSLKTMTEPFGTVPVIVAVS